MKKTSILTLAGLLVFLLGILVVFLIIRRDDHELLQNLSRMAAAGETEQARTELNTLLARGFDDFSVLVQAGELAAQISPEQANALFREALQREDRTGEGLLRLTDAAMRAGDFGIARTLLEETLRLDPGDPASFILAGRFNYLTNNHKEAVLYLESAFSRMDPSPHDKLTYAESLAMSGDIAQVILAKDILMELTEREDKVGIGAFVILGNMNHIPLLETELPQFLERFRQHPLLEEALVGNPGLMRRLIGRFESYDSAFALAVGSVLMRESDLPFNDRLSFAFIALKEGAFSEAERALEQVQGLDRESIEFRGLEAYLLMGQDRTASGVDRLESLAQSNPSSPAVFMMLEAILFINPPGLIHSEEERLAELLKNHPLAPPELRLQAYDLLINLRPGQSDALVDQAFEAFRDSNPIILAVWLRHRELNPKLLELTDAPLQANQRSILLGLRMDALLSLARYDALRQELEQFGDELNPTVRNLVEAELNFNSGDNAAAQRFWEMAFERASISSQTMSLRRLAAIAAREGDKERTYRAYHRLFTDGQHLSEPELTTFLTISMEKRGLEEALVVARQLAELHPENPTHINNSAYLNFLAGERVSESVDAMRTVVREYPNERHFRMTYALGLLRAGQTREALRIAEDTQIDMTPSGYQQQAIYAAILSANDRGAFASSIAANIDRERLYEPEQALLQNVSTPAR